jgi:hypothetical protein
MTITPERQQLKLWEAIDTDFSGGFVLRMYSLSNFA